MTEYKCTNCGNIQNHCEGCDSCKLWNSKMEMLQDYQNFAEDLNIGIYEDGGCLGCTTEKRKKMFLYLGFICILIGVGYFIFFLFSGFETFYWQTSVELFLLGLIWILCAYCCPDGPCGMYKKNTNR